MKRLKGVFGDIFIQCFFERQPAGETYLLVSSHASKHFKCANWKSFPFHQTCLQAENDQSKQWQRRLQWTVRSNGDILKMLAGGRYHIYFHYFCIT